MPSWFSSSLINQARNLLGASRSSVIEPPQSNLPIQSNEEESEYEEIENFHSYSNMNQNTMHPSEDGGQATCALCGNANPLVVCEMCNNQLFCASCNDMFHRHPRRHNHRRKLLEPLQSRPLPPPSKIHSVRQFQTPPPTEGPVPPPRRNKKLFGLRSANASPTFARRFPFDPMGSLRRFAGSGSPMIERPLPMPPLSQRIEQTNQNMAARNKLMSPGSVHGTWDRRQSAPMSQMQNPKNVQNFAIRSGSIANPGLGHRSRMRDENCIPVTVMELERNHRQQSIPKAPDKYCLPPSRDSGWDEDEEEILPRTQRAFSVSACNLQQFPTSSSDSSHFATLQRRGSSRPPARPPPPVPPRDFSQPRPMHPANSAFDLDCGDRRGAFAPWSNPVQPQFQQSFEFDSPQSHGYPEDSRRQTTLQRTQATLDQAMSLVELNLRDFARLERDSQQSYINQPPIRSISREAGKHVPPPPPVFARRPMTPRQPSPMPPQPLEPEYYSGDDGSSPELKDEQCFTSAAVDDVDLDDLKETPQGPWSCEHCTFINPKSTKICTVCCKTPVKGYQVVNTRESPIRTEKNRKGKAKVREIDNAIQSTLTFSNSKSQPMGHKISIEKVRKSSSKQDPVPVPAYESSGAESESESTSSDEITAKHRSLVRGSKLNTLKKGKATDEIESTVDQTTSRSSPALLSKSKPAPKMVDSGTGDYSILDSVFLRENRKHEEDSKSKSNSSCSTREDETAFLKKEPIEQKSSKGTSPPPQTISTQTYDELPGRDSKMSSKSISKMSLQSSGISRESSPPREMSEKALRYARRAQQHSQLKRSMSTHLTSTSTGTGSGEAWPGNGQSHRHQHEGRHLYRSSSRQSLASDTRSLPISGPPSRDISPPPRNRFEEFERMNRFGSMTPWDRFPPPAEFFLSMDDMMGGRKRRDSAKSQQEFELSRLLKDAEELNYTPEDLQVALRMCAADRNPVRWLEENWANMVETVQALATKFGRDRGQDFNEVGTISALEAKEALRLHKGNVWAAVTHCVEQRRKKFLELQSRGTFLREDVLTALTANKGNLDAAYVELSKNQLKPFLMRIWGPPSGKDNESAPPRPQTPQELKNVTSPPTAVAPFEVQLSPESTQETFPPNLLNSEIISDSENIPAVPTLSPEVNDLQTKAVEAEEETFYDPEPPTRAFSMSEDDGDLDLYESEAQVSSFIQNYEVPLPPPSPIPASPIADFQDAQTTSAPEAIQVSMKSQNNESLEANQPLTSGNLSVSEMESLLDPSSSASSSQALVSLSRAMNLIAEKLGVLLKNQQSTGEQSGGTNNEMKTTTGNRIEKPEEKVDESENKGELISAESTHLPPTKEQQIQILTEIYKQDLTLLKDIVLPQVQEPQSSQQLTPKVDHPAPPITIDQKQGQVNDRVAPDTKSASTKIYEALGNFAGSLLRGSGSSKSAKAKTSEPAEESLYETIAVSNGTFEAVPKHDSIKFIPTILETINSNPESRNSQTLDQETYYDISRMSSLGDMVTDALELPVEDDLNGIRQVEHELLQSFSGGEAGESENEILSDLEDYPSEDDSIDEGEGELDTKWAEVAYALNEAAFQETSSDLNKNNGVHILLESGKVLTLEKAELAYKLMDMNFSESDSIHAANECSSLYTAISFLQQECQLCTGKFSAKQMISMLRCSHSCCRTCATEYFMVQIRDQSILGATCPFCKEPTNLTEDSDSATDYFSHLEILLKDLLDEHHYDMFGRKLRDWTLSQTPNFKWCSKCSSGFITEPLQTHLICPDCNAVTCAICLEPWDKFNHEHRDERNSDLFCDDPRKVKPKSIAEYLNDNSIQCPKCRLKFTLARGGCMHLTCSQCRYEFCSGCLAPFAMGLRCKENAAFCAKLGLHAHHPRNCLFYLRDKEPELLMKLLKDSGVIFSDNAKGPESEADQTESSQSVRPVKCSVALQKETPDGLVDGTCTQDVNKGCLEVCQNHFTEYLGNLVWDNRLDPIPILTNDDLETIVKRACKKMPPRSYGTTDSDYRPLLLKVIQEEIPL